MQFASAFLCFSAFAAGRNTCASVSSAQLSLQLQLHQLPAQRSPRWLSVLWSDLSFDFGLARSCSQQDCLQHRGRPSSARRNSDGSRFLFRASGRRPNVRIPSFELRRLDFRKVWNVSYHLAVVASDELLGSQLFEQSSSMRHGRLQYLRTLLAMLEQNWTSYLVCVQAGCMCLSFCAACVDRFWHSWAESSFKCFCVSC